MGMIIDLEFPAIMPGRPRRTREQKGRRRIETDTPVVPRAVAASVWEEARVWLGEELPPEWVNGLALRANAIYARNPRFRQIIQRRGNAGRDWLWAFTRHWLAAMILSHRPDWHARLPKRYNVGAALPEPGHGGAD